MKISSFVCLFVIGAALGDSVVVNEVVDNLLENAKILATMKQKEKIKLKDIRKNFQNKVLGVTLNGEFEAYGGVVQDTTTLHRTADAMMSTEGDILKIEAAMGFSLLQIDFEKYNFRYLTLSSEGSLSARCTENSVSVKFGIQRDGDKCVVLLDHARLETLGGLDATFSGAGVMNQIGNLLVNWIFTYFNDTVKYVINQHLESRLREVLAKSDLCLQLPL